MPDEHSEPPAANRAPARPALAEQALLALRELLRGLRLPEGATGDLRLLHRGLLTVVLRLAFLRHVDPAAPGLLSRFADDRHDAWPDVLAGLRVLGAGHDAFEGRAELERVRVADRAVERALRALDQADPAGELDGEQLGAAYESLLEYRLHRARGPALAVRPAHRVVDLAELLAERPERRIHRLAEETGCALTGPAAAALRDADTLDQLVAALARKRSPHAPDVIAADSLYLQAGEERRRAGAHYTPPELTGPVVRTTLRPLLAALGEHPTPEQLLALTICDPATGSGAFLLETCRQLGEQLERAWARHGAPTSLTSAGDRRDHARRLVASRCLHGVDKDPCAVELTRLSLWLLARPPAAPLEFLPHALKRGDALVGLAPAQIAALRWDPEPALPEPHELPPFPAHAPPEPHALPSFPNPAPPEPHALPPFPDNRPRDLALLRTIGDALVAVFFAHDSDRRRDEQRAHALAPLVESARRGDPASRASLAALARTLQAQEPAVHPFHWELEFPAVFAGDAPGFDGFVGNPPFFWGNRISRAFGGAYRDWLLRAYPHSHGNSDLAAYFLRRAHALLRRGGALGFVTTNSIAEADTRQTGLDVLVRHGATIYEAVRSAEWGGSASVRVAHVFVRKGDHPGPARLDGRPVAAIGSDLRPSRAAWAAVPLRERAGQSYKGVDFGGTGFLLSPEQRAELLAAAPHEAACIWPVMNASTFVTSPGVRPAGFIINFTGLTLAEAERFPRCMAIVRARVLPRRAVDRRKARRERWWLYNEACAGLYRAIAGKPVVLACAVVAKYLAFAFVDARAVFTNALNVFTLDGPAALAVLQSRVHELWALTHGSSLRADPRYNPSDCFETFPFPRDWQRDPALAAASAAYDQCRRECMHRHARGLTAIYNRFHDPDERAAEIVALRELHAGLDRAVLTAYGWADLAARATCEFIRDPLVAGPRLRWPHAFADEVLARLLALNRERAAGERAAPVEPATPAPIRRRGGAVRDPSLVP